jgi:histone-lysine N-methyltransferase SETD3
LNEAAILDPRVKEFTLLRKHEFATRYNDYIPYLTKRYPKLFPSSFFNFQNYLWAATACYSRNWVVNVGSAGKATHIMVPVLVLVNHQDPSNHVLYDVGRRTFAIYAGRAGVTAGSEVFLSYGEKCNAKLLTDYGFAVENDGFNTTPDCAS